MKKIITTIAVTAISISMSLTAYAADMLDKNYIESEIWEDMWLGKSDNGTEFPEASFKHHLLDEWITQNYGSDDFDWSELGELKYQYKRYYENYIAGWDFNDDDNGNWTIDTEEHSYHFQLINHTWNMIDEMVTQLIHFHRLAQKNYSQIAIMQIKMAVVQTELSVRLQRKQKRPLKMRILKNL